MMKRELISIILIDFIIGFAKGHIVHCLDGEFIIELKTGEKFHFSKGMSYVVSDELSSHRSHTRHGVKLLIIDGDFLKSPKALQPPEPGNMYY